MPEQITNSRNFLNKFTEEMILAIKTNIEVDERKKIEEERMKRAIEVEKLKQKFSQYAAAPQQEIAKIKEVLDKPAVIETPKIQTTTVAQQIISKPIAPELKQIKEIETPKVIENKELPEGFQKSIREEKTVLPESKPIEPIKPAIIQTSIQQRPLLQKKPETQIKNIQIPANQVVEPGEVDFGKITFLVKDPMISYVECPGENKNVVLRRAGGLATTTQIVLSKEEISKIIYSFSEKARIPLIEGMLDARISNLEMSAVISETSSSSFIVKRNLLPPQKTETVLQRPIGPQTTIQRPPMMMRPVMQPFQNKQ